MLRPTLSALAAFAAMLPLAGQAADLDYSFVELGYVDAEYDDSDAELDGFALRGSLAFHQNYFAFAEYADLSDSGFDYTQFQVGVGGHWPLNERVDLVARVGIVQGELETRFFDEDDDGFTIGAHLRGEIMPKLELEGGVDYLDVDSGEDTSLLLAARYFFVENVSGGLRLQFGDWDVLGLEARLTF